MKLVLILLLILSLSANAGETDMSGSGSLPNDTQTCAQLHQGPVEPSFSFTHTAVERSALIFFYMNVCFFGTLLNSFVIFLVARFKTLRTIEFAFAIQIILVNLACSLILVPISLISLIRGQWFPGPTTCTIIGAIQLGFGTLRTLLMMTFVTDRFFNVFFTMRYPRYRKKFLGLALPLVYVVFLAVMIVPAVRDCESFSPTTWICRINPHCRPECQTIRNVISLAVIAPATLLPVFLYIALFCKARNTVPAAHEMANDAETKGRASRAFITIALMFFSLFLVNFPPEMLNVIANNLWPHLSPDNSQWYHVLDSITLNTIIVTYLTDPMFILRNKDVREALPQLTWLPSFLYCKYN